MEQKNGLALLDAHLSDDEAVAKMHPGFCGSFVSWGI